MRDTIKNATKESKSALKANFSAPANATKSVVNITKAANVTINVTGTNATADNMTTNMTADNMTTNATVADNKTANATVSVPLSEKISMPPVAREQRIRY